MRGGGGGGGARGRGSRPDGVNMAVDSNNLLVLN